MASVKEWQVEQISLSTSEDTATLLSVLNSREAGNWKLEASFFKDGKVILLYREK